MSALVAMPILLPMAAAVGMLFLGERFALQRRLHLGAAAAELALAILLLLRVESEGVFVVQAGGWQAPFGISLVADLLSSIMVVASGIVGLTTAIWSFSSDSPGQANGPGGNRSYHPLVQLLLMGVNGAFLTGDVFNLYVWFEVMLISSFVLLVLGGSPPQLEGAIKYVTINLLSSAIFLAAVGILYAVAGTLNMADLAVRIPRLGHGGLLSAVAVLFMVTFGIKAAVFPLFFWLPASYHTPPIAVSALFAGLLTKVGVYAIMRFFTVVFSGTAAAFVHEALLWISACTMLVGVLGAAAQYDVRKLLSFHIISQIGYMVFAIALQSPFAIAAGIVYILHNILAKTNLFYVGGLMKRVGGSFDLRELGGLWVREPLLGAGFLVSALALAGIPPLSGFWAKLAVVRAGLDSGAYAATAVALLVSLITLFSMTKIWNEAFWKDDPRPVPGQPVLPGGRLASFAPILLLAGLILAFSFGFEPLFDLARRAALQLLDAAPGPVPGGAA